MRPTVARLRTAARLRRSALRRCRQGTRHAGSARVPRGENGGPWSSVRSSSSRFPGRIWAITAIWCDIAPPFVEHKLPVGLAARPGRHCTCLRGTRIARLVDFADGRPVDGHAHRTAASTAPGWTRRGERPGAGPGAAARCRAARTLTGARYSALGLLDDSGTELAEFITSGIDDEGRRLIGDLPRGRGILGVLIRDAHRCGWPISVRIPLLGFPPGHPPMRSFLGVP